MTPNRPEILRERGGSLEDEFFCREDQRLMERLRGEGGESTREALAKASGITKPAVLDRLMELGIRAETVAALSVSRWRVSARPTPRILSRTEQGRARTEEGGAEGDLRQVKDRIVAKQRNSIRKVSSLWWRSSYVNAARKSR
jgi:hypothetical protein